MFYLQIDECESTLGYAISSFELVLLKIGMINYSNNVIMTSNIEMREWTAVLNRCDNASTLVSFRGSDKLQISPAQHSRQTWREKREIFTIKNDF